MVAALRTVRGLLPWEVFWNLFQDTPSRTGQANGAPIGSPFCCWVFALAAGQGAQARAALRGDQPVLRSPAAIPLMEM
jgi:hypothetical protein